VGPYVVAAFPRDPMMWTAMLVSLVIAAFLSYELALDTPSPIVRWPAWMRRLWRLFDRWFPRVVMPVLLTVGWWWA
jgi:hypothetical protein